MLNMHLCQLTEFLALTEACLGFLFYSHPAGVGVLSTVPLLCYLPHSNRSITNVMNDERTINRK